MVSDFRKKQKGEFFTANFWFRTGGIFILILVAALVFADYKIYQKRQNLISQIDAYNKQIEEIKQRNESLKEQISKSDDKDYIEKIAREELDMQKEGEKVVVVTETTNQDNKNQTEPNLILTNENKKGVLNHC